MTNTDTELFELCKQVYEATGWRAGDWYYERTDPKSTVALKTIGSPYVDFLLDEYDVLVPLYTSDYLLEKLPFPTEIGCDSFMWIGKYENRGNQIWERADTPLKALLKLTLKLHEEK